MEHNHWFYSAIFRGFLKLSYWTAFSHVVENFVNCMPELWCTYTHQAPRKLGLKAKPLWARQCCCVKEGDIYQTTSQNPITLCLDQCFSNLLQCFITCEVFSIHVNHFGCINAFAFSEELWLYFWTYFIS